MINEYSQEFEKNFHCCTEEEIKYRSNYSLDLDVETSEYLSDSFYTGKNLKRLKRKKPSPKKMSKNTYLRKQASIKQRDNYNKFFMDTYTLWGRVSRIIEIPNKPELKNRIRCPMKYGDECFNIGERGLFRASPMTSSYMFWDEPFVGAKRILREKYRKTRGNIYGWCYRSMPTTPQRRDACSYSRFTRGKRSINSIPNSWDDHWFSSKKTYYWKQNLSWKYLSKFKKQWSKW